MIINYWLAQSAFHPVDTFCPYEKQFDLLEAILEYREFAFEALGRGVPVDVINSAVTKDALAKIRLLDDYKPELEKVMKQMADEFKVMS